MRAELRVEVGGERAFIAGGEIGFDVANFAHAGNDGGNVRIIKNEAERYFGQRGIGRNERFQGVGAFDAVFQIFRDEVGVAPIAFGPRGIEGERAGERAFIEWDAGDDADVVLAACGKEFVFGILVKDVVDDLHGVNETGFYGADPVFRFPAILADANGSDFSGRAEFFDGGLRAGIIEPSIHPRVVLNEVERFEAEIFEALIDVLEDILRRVAIIE